MRSIRYSVTHWLSSRDDFVQFCFGLTAGCFLAGVLLAVASCFFPIGPRAIGLIAVGCFYLAHALVALANQWWNRLGVPVERARKYAVSRSPGIRWTRQWEGGIAG